MLTFFVDRMTKIRSNIKLLVIVPAILGSLSQVFAQSVRPDNSAVPAATPVAPQKAYASTAAVNYLRSYTPSMPSTDPAVITATARTVTEVKRQTQYVDGLGRPLQTVGKGISPAGSDKVAPVQYDKYNREIYQYLPYIPLGGNVNDGNLKTDPFNAQRTFYRNATHNPGIGGDSVFYSQIVYESSPLARPLNSYAAGNTWSTKPLTLQYLLNTAADSVRIWDISLTNGLPPSSIAGRIYAAGELYKNSTTDERGIQLVEYKDKSGRVVLKKLQLATSPGTAHVGWLCTYYVYDDLGNLRWVIPPKAVDLIKGSWTIDTNTASELCFIYRYDNRNRMIVKKIPGADSVEMVYDIRDRLVFSRDGNLKDSSKWLVTFYDGLNRATMTAFYASSSSRDVLQTSMNTATASQTVSYTFPGTADLEVAYHDGRPTYTATNSITLEDGFDTGNGEVLAEINASANNGTTSITATNPLPGIPPASLTPLTYTYYDNYNFAGAQPAVSGDFAKPFEGGNPYKVRWTAVGKATQGLVTGIKTRVLGTDQWLTTTTYFTDKGEVAQVIADNISGGQDVSTNLYDFSGKQLSTYLRHRNIKSSLTPQTTVLTMMHYDAAGRVDSLKKRINDADSLQRTIALNSYNEIGQTKSKRLGVTGTSTQLETLGYEYNVRGWLKGINKSYVNTAASASNWFGQEISYDYGFTVPQFNGNIAGIKWKSRSDSISRAYGYSYDNASRLVAADFSQQNKGSTNWTNDKMNFSVSGITYDANGNILLMNQRGMDGTAIQLLDSLKYGYLTNSNRLSFVTDRRNNASSQLGDFKEINNNETVDYDYDDNGNLKKDLNKNITSITYNHLNLPVVITIAGKGTIQYVYDATGVKLRKVVTDNTGTPSKTTITDYIGGFVYRNDTLQFLAHEEGRVRPLIQTGVPLTFKYDYFLKDHLGNVRAVLTEQTDFSMYTATMESSAAATEAALFSNVEETRTAKPAGYPDDEAAGKNQFVAKLNAKDGGKKIGPSLVLRVMAGDTIQIGARAFYKSNGPKDNKDATPEEMLAGLLQAFGGKAVGDASHGAIQEDNLSPFGNMTSNDYRHLKEKNQEEGQKNRPKAYLNFVLFDDQFNLVDANSGVRQVKDAADELQTLSVDKMTVGQSGFLYVYTSNEVQQDVFFDNLAVAVNSGPLLEETHYYPYGLTMAGISSNALKGLNYPENRKKYNGIEYTKDFDLNQYDAFYRTLDPQIGRWRQIDPAVENFEDITPYNHVLNNPVNMSDPFGDDTVHVNNLQNVWPDFDSEKDVVALNGIVVTPEGSHPEASYKSHANVGYQVMTEQSWFSSFLNPYRTYGGYVVNNRGILTNMRAPVAGVPNGLVTSGSLGGGVNLIRVGNSIRTIIRDIKWTSKGVALAAKMIRGGVKEVTVKSKAEAEELLLGLFGGRGLRNTTGMSATEAKNFFGTKSNTYHWDEVVDEAGRLLNHAADNAHAAMKHLQIHDADGNIFRIFFE